MNTNCSLDCIFNINGNCSITHMASSYTSAETCMYYRPINKSPSDEYPAETSYYV